jgi:predicted metalloprotease
MRLGGRRESENVRDTRGRAPKRVVTGGIGALVIAAIVFFATGGDLQKALQFFGQQQQAAQRQAQAQGPQGGGAVPPKDDPTRVFLARILGGTEDCWSKLFAENPRFCRNQRYEPPILNIFSDRVQTACGGASSAVGPFYCPADRMVYIDPTFFDDLRERHNTEGDFAHAYVLAHEVGHHVQNLIGYSARVNEIRRRGSKLDANRASVRLELQADYLAGVWAHHDHQEYGSLEDNDIEEALNAAYNIGDDTLQKQATGMVRPAHFTHGTSEQRVRWFRKGLVSGDIQGCDQLFDERIDADDL